MRVSELQVTGTTTVHATSDGCLVLFVPVRVKRHSARKQILGPATREERTATSLHLTPFQLALVKGYRWLAMLEAGEATSMKELAEREKTDPSLVSRLVNLTMLGPDLVQAILDDKLPEAITLLDLAISPSPIWSAPLATYVASRPGVTGGTVRRKQSFQLRGGADVDGQP